MRAIARLFNAASTGGSSSVNRRAFRRAGLAFTLLLLFVASSSPRDARAQPVSKIGAATSIENEVEGRLGQSVAKLSVGSDVFRDQLVRTGKASTAELQFLDQTNLSLLASTEIKLDRFVYEPDKKSGAIVLNVPRGVVRFVTGSLPSRSYAIRTPLVMVGVRGTTFDVLVWPDRVTVLLIAGAVDLTVRARRIYVLNEPNTAITIYRDGRIVGPRAWTGTVTDFANLAPPSPPASPRRAATPTPQNTAVAPQPNRAAGTGGSSGAIDRLGGGSTINTVGGGGVGFAGGGRPRPAAPCPACAPKGGGSASGGGINQSKQSAPNPNIDYGSFTPRRTWTPGDPK